MVACTITVGRDDADEEKEYRIKLNGNALRQLIRAMAIYDLFVDMTLKDCGPFSRTVFTEYQEQNDLIATKLFRASEWGIGLDEEIEEQ